MERKNKTKEITKKKERKGIIGFAMEKKNK